MGQANKRGTYEQRKAEAVAREEARRAEEAKRRTMEHPRGHGKSHAAIVLRLAAAMLAGT